MNQSGEDLETESDMAPDILLAKVNNLLKIIGIPLEKQLKQIDELKSVRLVRCVDYFFSKAFRLL